MSFSNHRNTSSLQATFSCLEHSHRAAGKNVKVFRDYVCSQSTQEEAKGRRDRDASSGPCFCHHIHPQLCYSRSQPPEVSS